MDAIVLHQYGFDQSVASLGTALTEKQVGIIKKLTKNMVLALDADAAGQMATLRGIEVASRTFDQKVMPLPTASGLMKYESLLDADIRVIVLPDGKDPDEVVKENPEEWRRLLASAVPVVDYTFALVASKLDLTKVKDKSLAADQLLPLIAEIRGPVSRAHYLQRLSRLVGVSELSLAAALNKPTRPDKTSRKCEGARPSSASLFLQARDALAEYCLCLLARFPHLRGCAGELSEEFFLHSEDCQLFLSWRNAGDIDSLLSSLDTSLRSRLETLMNKKIPTMSEEEQEDAISDCIRRMHERWLKEQKMREEALNQDMQADGNRPEFEDMQQSGVTLNAQLLDVFLQKRRKGMSAGDRKAII
ncbi:MAG: toprim domain-containing protein [Chloroflexi bacterium]|nr:toprim domain-containing protein [Chloroflexota bacterium]